MSGTTQATENKKGTGNFRRIVSHALLAAFDAKRSLTSQFLGSANIAVGFKMPLPQALENTTSWLLTSR